MDLYSYIEGQYNSLPATGGVITLPGDQGGPYTCSQTIVLAKPNVTIQGQGKGGFYAAEGATTLQFPPGVPGIDIGAGHCVIRDLMLTSVSTAAGSDYGIRNRGGATIIERVTVTKFGSHGLVTVGEYPASADSWGYADVEIAYCFGDGFRWDSPATDNHVGFGKTLSSWNNKGWGFNILQGQKNKLFNLLTQNNALGSFSVRDSGNYIELYCEEGTGSLFVLQPGVVANEVWFNLFGQPQTIQDNSGTSANIIHFWGTGSKPAVNQLNLSTLDGKHGYSFFIDASGNLVIWDQARNAAVSLLQLEI